MDLSIINQLFKCAANINHKIIKYQYIILPKNYIENSPFTKFFKILLKEIQAFSLAK